MESYLATRQATWHLCTGLTPEDMVAQSMPEASPSKWHLAHTTWFFETFLLKPNSPNYQAFHPQFEHLFNSYYESVGNPYLRPQRGFLTRPALEDVLSYRQYVDDAMLSLLDNAPAEVKALTEVGLHHEMQHQELLLTDVLHLLAHNPLAPQVKTPNPNKENPNPIALTFQNYKSEFVTVGADANQFSYDNERPQHQHWQPAFGLANRLITNGEWLSFMEDNGYNNPLLWLSDGWATVKKEHWQAPLYWQQRNDAWHQYGLDGLQPIVFNAPVCHISYYEADAFARWAGKRLPKEQELEVAMQQDTQTVAKANLLEQSHWRPQPATTGKPSQLTGDVWEWTQSPYAPYPNFKPEQGALGEYNGKFMANQMVLKGGSCITPALQLRASYRNFFYPHQRWQFSGLRLADER